MWSWIDMDNSPDDWFNRIRAELNGGNNDELAQNWVAIGYRRDARGCQSSCLASVQLCTSGCVRTAAENTLDRICSARFGGCLRINDMRRDH